MHGVGDHSRNKIDQILSSCILKPIIAHRAKIHWRCLDCSFILHFSSLDVSLPWASGRTFVCQAYWLSCFHGAFIMRKKLAQQKVEQISPIASQKCTGKTYKYKNYVEVLWENTQLSLWGKVKRSSDKLHETCVGGLRPCFLRDGDLSRITEWAH